ncbi:alpha/beta hydrolase [Actinomadura scrupuli]|uniref:alpha/beta hydrolase n=1 Tax=Actinomadura scrupuli TaxID=559629 RepID=UPI003D98F546
MSEVPQPRLAVRGPAGQVRAIALVLHGGRANSHEPAAARQPAALRMVPFARSLERAGRPCGLAVWSLGYRYRGWNGAEASPVPDARWALDLIRQRHGDLPVALVGHSMGGRTALRIADDPLVRSVAALAPWLPEGEPTGAVAGRQVLIMHGTDDQTTDPGASLAYALHAPAARIAAISVRREGHAMLRRPGTWHRLTTGFVLGSLGCTAMPPELDAAWNDAPVVI